MFDTSALASYVRKEFVEDAFKRSIPYPYKVGLGGRTIIVKEETLLWGKIEGLVGE